MTSKLTQAYDSKSFRSLGHELVDILADYLDQAMKGDLKPVLPKRSPDALFEKYAIELQLGNSLDARSFFEEVIADSIHLHHPGYVGHQLCPPAPLSALSGLAAELLNNGSAIFEMGPANTAMEKLVLDLTARATGYREGSGGVFTSGGSLGNLTALLAAQKAVGPAKDRQSGETAFMISDASHYSVEKSLKIMGLGKEQIVRVPTDHLYRIRLDALEPVYQAAQSQGLKVIGLVANACTTATGSYDRLEDMADFASKKGLWFHVDGAHGMAVIFSERHRSKVAGAELADSVVIDFHKMLMAPALTTAVLFKESRHCDQTFQEKASYLWHEEKNREWFNFSKRTLECTKLMMGFKVFSLLRLFGTELFSEHVDHLYGLAAGFAAEIKKRPSLELAQEPQSNIVCFRVFDPKASPATLDRLNASIRQRIIDGGNFYIVQAELRKGLFLRTALMNPLTSLDDLAQLLDEVEATATEIPR